MAGSLTHTGSLRLGNSPVAVQPRVLPISHSPASSAPDPRWVVAVATARVLDGGRAAILVPESRDHVLRIAGALGLRPFDANLIIAIVQDAARRGESLGGAVSDRLQHVPAAEETPDLPPAALIITSLLLAAVLLLAMIVLIF